MNVHINPDLKTSLEEGKAVVALESTVITHGLPRPQNLALALDLERVIKEAGAIPATVGIIGGELIAGLTHEQMDYLANADAQKASLWNLAAISALEKDAGTTVATTLLGARKAGIQVFATGGIGGVHGNYDESADLYALANYSLVTVCAGPKSILNVAATLERLETLGVPVIGYQSDYLAGFHTPETSITVPARADSAAMIAKIFRLQQSTGLKQGLLVSKPVSNGIAREKINTWIETAFAEARKEGFRGKDVTPFLLSHLAELSNGQTVEVNLRLLKENAKLAADIAVSLSATQKPSEL